jgi:hypothetical protein
MRTVPDPTLFPALHDPALWCPLSGRERRDLLAAALAEALAAVDGVDEVWVEAGTIEHPEDYTAVVETGVGRLRTPLWSDARARVFCDPSVHPANRRQLAPAPEVERAAARLRSRLEVRFTLEARGLSLEYAPEPGVRRTWTAERARFRDRTAVTREDVVAKAGEVDLRDLLAHFYTGPSLRAVGDDGTAFLLPAASEEEGRLVTLCPACGRWAEGPHPACPTCGAPADTALAVRPGRR